MLRRLSIALLAALFFPSVARADSTGATPVGAACTSDAQCAIGSICTDAVCTALPKKKSIIPFYFHQPGEVGHRHIVPLLYFSTWDREGKTRVQFPFYGRSVDYASGGDKTIIPPLLFWYGKYQGQGEQVGWMPLFYWRRRGLDRTLALPLLLSGGRRDGAEDLTEALIGLVGYYRRHHDDTWRILFPLIFDHRTATERTTFAPPLLAYFHHTPTRKVDVLFPLFWHISDLQKGTRHALLLPLADYESDHFGRRARLVSLLAAWERNDDTKLRQLILFAPPIFHRQDALRDVDVVPPLFTRWRVHDDDSSGVIAGPFFHHSDPEGSTTALLPLYWRFHDLRTGAETQFLFPVAGFHHHPGAGGAFLGPFYGWSSKNGSNGRDGWGAGIAPLLLFGRTGPKHHAVVAPIFFHWSDDRDRTSSTAVGPVFFHRAANGSGWDAGLFPALFFGRRGATTYAMVPPIFWHRTDADGTTDVVGPAYVYHGRRGYKVGLVPLAFFGKVDGEEHQVILPPLFIRFANAEKRQEKLLAGPFYHARDGDETVDALFPLFYLKRAPGRGFMISPLAGWKKERGTETVIVGLYGYQHNARKHSTTHFLFPLGAVHDAPNYHVTVQFPFYWRVREGQETDTTIFPFYWRVRSPGKDVDAVFPLLLHFKTKIASTTLVGPLWNRVRADGGRTLGLFPIFGYGKSVKPNGQSSSWFGTPGVYWAKNEWAGSSELVAGPFFYVRRPHGYTTGILPLTFVWRRGTATKVVTPLFYRQADSAGDYALNVLGPFYFGHTGTMKRFGLLPFFYEKWRPDGTSSTTLFPLFYFQKKLLGSILATPIFGYSKYPTGTRTYVGPLYVRRDDQVSSTAIWPLIYFTRNHATHTLARMILPFYFEGRAEDGRELAEYTPLIWRYHSVERSIVVGLPLFFDVHSYGESRTTGLLPLFVRNRSSVYHSTSWFFPAILTWARTRHGEGGGTDVAVFPLIWRFGGKDSTTVVAPLFWDWKRGEDRTQVMFPLYARWKRADSDHTLVLNMYYRKGKGPKEGSWYCDIFPITSFGRPRKHDMEWKILEGLLGYSRLGRNRILHLFWIFDIPLEPVPASSLSWWSSTPASARTEMF